MGTIKKGILGGFSGKVGTVVGAAWKGIDYMRSLATKIKNPKTKAQLAQRAKFSLAVKFLSDINPYITYGYKNYTAKQTAANFGLKFIMKNNCIVGEYPDYSLDLSLVKVALGQLKAAETATATLSSGTAAFRWTDNSGDGNAMETDLAMALLYNKDKGEAAYSIGNATRVQSQLDFSYPTSWAGDEVAAYFAYMSEDGSLVSESSYLGLITA